ncbi:unnamed protein product [Strongylus vulgaris]|uniref:Uncharacterized protein n=1 Tax=Strongylus vulgaris TaxID=40348 RepID=A0A3P7J2R3_STRVU|nr:unnamed protein product [Strongylus vulgaris]
MRYLKKVILLEQIPNFRFSEKYTFSPITAVDDSANGVVDAVSFDASLVGRVGVVIIVVIFVISVVGVVLLVVVVFPFVVLVVVMVVVDVSTVGEGELDASITGVLVGGSVGGELVVELVEVVVLVEVFFVVVLSVVFITIPSQSAIFFSMISRAFFNSGKSISLSGYVSAQWAVPRIKLF